ncbi:MAG: DNA gyrase inhibitor YacG [Rhodobiaceae bacterium]|nr:MAG: DNA gyrase inhibitor YacG [Rhodobiaceae bacterium]
MSTTTNTPVAGPEGAPGTDNVTPLRPARPCALCSKKAVQKFHPFCSKHCADVDLNRWLKGSYVIPASEESEDWSEEQDEGA